MNPIVSIVIVTYKVKDLLARCLDSLKDASASVRSEIIVVDNASEDGTTDLLQIKYPETILITNPSNVGFGRACNIGFERSKGDFILFLNPDTLVQTDTLKNLVEFFNAHENAGIVGPKILNPDATLQLACRRSFPTPAVALSRFVGLSRFFPKSTLLGRYNLTFLDPEKESEVDAVSGSCFMIRRPAMAQSGGFDEDFFMYGEDLDLCHRIKSAGWKIYYTPSTQIVHFKGESAKRRPIRSRLAFYGAMFHFSRKHVATRHSFLPSWLLYAGFLIYACMGLLRTALSNFSADLHFSPINYFLST